jgi:hypothetical protein
MQDVLRFVEERSGKSPRRMDGTFVVEDIASDWLGITLILLPIEAAEGHGSMPALRGRQQLACPLDGLERACRLPCNARAGYHGIKAQGSAACDGSGKSGQTSNEKVKAGGRQRTLIGKQVGPVR